MENERKTLDDRAEDDRPGAAPPLRAPTSWPPPSCACGPTPSSPPGRRSRTAFTTTSNLQHRISPEDFPAIEAEMKKEIKANHAFEKIVVTREQAIEGLARAAGWAA